ncbi:MAG: arsenite methyltransferase [Anaerolineae bacterium]
MSSNPITEQVREHYAEIARQALDGNRASCCGGASLDCCSSSDTIPVQALAALQDDTAMPEEVIQTTLGCGTPLELAAIQPGETVLDLGSGGGLDCFYAARLTGPTGHVIGVDMTPAMLELAAQNQQKVGLTNVEFRRGQIEALPVADASVDVIISNCVINLSPDKDQVFREAFRVLKPGGRVALSDEVARVGIPAGLRKNMDSWAACVAGAISSAEYMTKMQAAGFEDVQVRGAPGKLDLVYSARFLGRKPARG